MLIRVALARGEADREDAFDFGEPGRVEVEIGGGRAFLEVIRGARSGARPGTCTSPRHRLSRPAGLVGPNA